MERLSDRESILRYINPFIREDWRYSEEDLIEANDSEWTWNDYDIFESFEEVHESFENGGRWSNYVTQVYSIGDKYFEFIREVPASETQDGMDLTFSVTEVFPKEVTTITYE